MRNGTRIGLAFAFGFCVPRLDYWSAVRGKIVMDLLDNANPDMDKAFAILDGTYHKGLA